MFVKVQTQTHLSSKIKRVYWFSHKVSLCHRGTNQNILWSLTIKDHQDSLTLMIKCKGRFTYSLCERGIRVVVNYISDKKNNHVLS